MPQHGKIFHYYLLIVITQILLNRCRCDLLPSIRNVLGPDDTLTVREGSDSIFTCHGLKNVTWRFPGRQDSCFDKAKITHIKYRTETFNIHVAEGYFSRLTLRNTSWLDVGYIECYYIDSPTESDSFYLYVNSSTHPILPCLPATPENPSSTCKLPEPKSRSIPMPLANEESYVPCRSTHENVKLQVKLEVPYDDLHEITPIFEPFRGFRILEASTANISTYIVTCRAANYPTSELCYYRVQYASTQNRACRLEMFKSVTRSPWSFSAPSNSSGHAVYLNSDVNLICRVECPNYPKGISLQLSRKKESEQNSKLADFQESSIELSTSLGRTVYVAKLSYIALNVIPMQDDGLYSCEFSLGDSKLETSSRIAVQIPEAPKFLNNDAVLHFNESLNATTGLYDADVPKMDCWADGVPSPRYQWYHGSMANELNDEVSGELSRQDPGVYFCRVSNGVGTVLERKFQLGQADTKESTLEPSNSNIAGWIVGLIAAIVLGFVLAFALIGFFVYWRLRRNNRRVKLRALWKQYFSTDGFVPLELTSGSITGTQTSITLETPLALSLSDARSQLNLNRGTSQASGHYAETAETETPWLGEQLDQVPYQSGIYEIDPKQLEFREILGRGAFGVVYKADLKSSGKSPLPSIPVAVKCIRDSFDTEQYTALSSEIKLLATVGHHVNIVNLIGAVTRSLEDGVLYMVLEFCPGGALRRFLSVHRDRFCQTEEFDYFTLKAAAIASAQDPETDYLSPSVAVCSPTPIPAVSPISPGYPHGPIRNVAYTRKSADSSSAPLLVENNGYQGQHSEHIAINFGEVNRDRLSTRDLTTFAYQIANGMQFLHARHCLHRDLAARNILVCSGNVLKISDFGLAKDVYKYGGEYKKKKDGKVPFKWLAPECIRYQIYNKETDIWAFGVLLWEIFTLGKVPYTEVQQFDENFVKLLEEDFRLPRPDYADDFMSDLIVSCWHSQPKARPSFQHLRDEIRKRLPASIVLYYDQMDNVPVAVSQNVQRLSSKAVALSEIPEETTHQTPLLPSQNHVPRLGAPPAPPKWLKLFRRSQNS